MILNGNLVSIRPLEASDAAEIWSMVGGDEETWRWLGGTAPMPTSAEDLRRDFEARLNTKSSESFAIVDNESGKAIGATSFLDIREGDRHLEVGSTFIVPPFRSGFRNIECKLLLLAEAFEVRQCVRVTLKANAANARSRAAIEKIGAKFEVLLRNQRLETDGSWRTAAYYSVIVEEWPETKAHLLKLLGRD